MPSAKIVYIVDDDDAMRESLAAVLEDGGYEVHAYSHAEDFLGHYCAGQAACVVSDVRMPGMDGIALLRRIRETHGDKLPLVLITGHGDIPLAVEAMKVGAVDFLEKPFEPNKLLAAVEAAFRMQSSAADEIEAADAARRKLEKLTSREVDVYAGLVAGDSNKQLAAKLGLSPRTVEFHRAHIMDKTGARSLPELVRLWMSAGQANDIDTRTTTVVRQ